MEIQCSHCQQLISVTPEMAGQQVSCPHCAAALVVPGATQVAAAPPAYVPPHLKPKKGKSGCLMGVLGTIAVLVAIGLFFWFQDSKLRDHGIAQIEAMDLPDDTRLAYLAVAKHYHNHAANSGERVSKRSTGTPSKEGYWKALKGMIERDLGQIPESPDSEAIAANAYLWRAGMEHFVLRLKGDGTYEKAQHWDSDKSYSDPYETFTGKWSADGDQFRWQPDDGSAETQRILRMGREGFVLKIDDSEASYWQRR